MFPSELAHWGGPSRSLNQHSSLFNTPEDLELEDICKKMNLNCSSTIHIYLVAETLEISILSIS